MVMMRLPPGVPSTPTLSLPRMMVGLMELSGRLCGAISLAVKPISPKALGSPGLAEKSSISLFSMKPVPGTMKRSPKARLTVMVAATMLPSLSMMEMCVVLSPSWKPSLPGSMSLGVARLGLMEARRPSA